MEALSKKSRVEYTNNQLSGLGFSTTQHNTITLKITDEEDKERIIKVSI